MDKHNILYILGSSINEEEILVSCESLMVLFILQCCECLDTEIIFTNYNTSPLKETESFNVESSSILYKYGFLDFQNCPDMIQNCLLPAVFIQNELKTIVGMSSSLRHLLIEPGNSSKRIANQLLGFRRGCLQACAEVSTWTKFCEIEAVEMLRKVYFENNCDREFTVPAEIIRYENHLKCPPIMHNALKRKQEYLEKSTQDRIQYLTLKKKKLKELPELEHKYAEGLDLTLADLLLYVPFSLCFKYLINIVNLPEICPLVNKWLICIDEEKCITEGKSLINQVFHNYKPVPKHTDFNIYIPDVPKESLYKSDPNRYKSRWRMFTHQNDIDVITTKIKDTIKVENACVNLDALSLKNNEINNDLPPNNRFKCTSISDKNSSLQFQKLFIHDIDFQTAFNWKHFPSEIIPLDGGLPANRLERKCQQLESMAQVIISIAKSGNKIIDFCSGGGHLGILLAFCLPNCSIVLIENKRNSLEKAYRRVQSLKLKNVQFYQCNLDYFIGKFDIGVCLHACGVATDLVMHKCFRQKAAFVCGPCCYGSVKPNHIVDYPCSSFYKDFLHLSLSEYLILGHAADQTHDEKNPKTKQGKECMIFVDCDRLLNAQSLGYSVYLAVMKPPHCTPKNHMLIGLI